VDASPKFGRFLRMDLFGLECWVDGEAIAPGYSSAVVDNVGPSRARLAKQLTERLVRPRTRNVLCPNIGGLFDR
jgi:hypothetical protein